MEWVGRRELAETCLAHVASLRLLGFLNKGRSSQELGIFLWKGVEKNYAGGFAHRDERLPARQVLIRKNR
jgi:hypothetical protein